MVPDRKNADGWLEWTGGRFVRPDLSLNFFQSYQQKTLVGKGFKKIQMLQQKIFLISKCNRNSQIRTGLIHASHAFISLLIEFMNTAYALVALY